MDEWEQQILNIITEHNIRGEPIHYKKLENLMGKTSLSITIHKRVRRMVEDGVLVEEFVSLRRGTRKDLYLSGFKKLDPKESDKLDRILETQEEILRRLNRHPEFSTKEDGLNIETKG